MGVLFSIDQSKAFDSVSHDFMAKVYSFFGFGNRIKNWLKTTGTGRTASVQLGKNATTTEFPLEKGHAQGDSPSPILNNLAAQIIFFFKIQLNPLIKKNDKVDVPAILSPPIIIKMKALARRALTNPLQTILVLPT
jgi:hypothetical protein